LTKDLEEKLDRYISNQVDETLEDEVEDHRQQIFQELNEIRRENATEINAHFKKMGFPPLNPEVLKDDRYQRYYQTDGDFYDGYPMHQYGLQHAWRGGRNFSPLNRQFGGYPYNSFAVPESFKSAKSPSKFLDEMPKNETKIDDEVDGFQH